MSVYCWQRLLAGGRSPPPQTPIQFDRHSLVGDILGVRERQIEE
jgi:hypothetical protein